MKSIEERMAVLLNPAPEAALTEQMLDEAVDAANSILEANGLSLEAEALEDYVAGLQDILENYELSEEDYAELHALLNEGAFSSMVRGAAKVAGHVGRAIGTAKKAKAAVGSAIDHVRSSYVAGHLAGETPDPKGGMATGWAAPEKKPETGPKKPGLIGRAMNKYKAWKAKPKEPSKMDKEFAKQRAAKSTPADQHVAKTSAALAAKQDAAKSKAEPEKKAASKPLPPPAVKGAPPAKAKKLISKKPTASA